MRPVLSKDLVGLVGIILFGLGIGWRAPLLLIASVIALGFAVRRVPRTTQTLMALIAGAVLVWLWNPATRTVALPCAAIASVLCWRSVPRPSVAVIAKSGRLLGAVLGGSLIGALSLGVLFLLVREPHGLRYGGSQLQPSGLGVVVVAVGNAFFEELVWRGLLADAFVRQGWITGIVQAISFALAHHRGYPSGWSGLALTAVFGIVLFGLRRRTGSMTGPVIAHTIADIGILAWLL